MDFFSVESETHIGTLRARKGHNFSHMPHPPTYMAHYILVDLTLLKKYVIILKKGFFSKSEKKCVELPQNGATAQYSSVESYSSEGICSKREYKCGLGGWALRRPGQRSCRFDFFKNLCYNRIDTLKIFRASIRRPRMLRSYAPLRYADMLPQN